MGEQSTHAPPGALDGCIAVSEKEDICSEAACKGGCLQVALPYWCETCRRAVAKKRCPGCGLKARKTLQQRH
jgi:hypothetical protein